MHISYRPLWVLLAKREMTKKELREKKWYQSLHLLPN